MQNVEDEYNSKDVKKCHSRSIYGWKTEEYGEVHTFYVDIIVDTKKLIQKIEIEETQTRKKEERMKKCERQQQMERDGEKNETF